MSKSKMGEAFKAQARSTLLSPSKRQKLQNDLNVAIVTERACRSKLEMDDDLSLARTWFYYGWQACEGSQKP